MSSKYRRKKAPKKNLRKKYARFKLLGLRRVKTRDLVKKINRHSIRKSIDSVNKAKEYFQRAIKIRETGCYRGKKVRGVSIWSNDPYFAKELGILLTESQLYKEGVITKRTRKFTFEVRSTDVTRSDGLRPNRSTNYYTLEIIPLDE